MNVTVTSRLRDAKVMAIIAEQSTIVAKREQVQIVHGVSWNLKDPTRIRHSTSAKLDVRHSIGSGRLGDDIIATQITLRILIENSGLLANTLIGELNG